MGQDRLCIFKHIQAVNVEHYPHCDELDRLVESPLAEPAFGAPGPVDELI
jgi:hypothetical protein